MSLDNIKDITTEARNNLVNAIRTRGVSIADDSTINQCANAVLMITGGGESMKFYKCASVNIPQTNTETTPDTGKPTYIVSNASLGDGVNGTYTYLGEVNDPSYSSTCLLWKNTKDNGYYIYYGGFGWVIVTEGSFDSSGFTPNVPPLYVIVQNVYGTNIYAYSDEYAGKGTFAPYRAESSEADSITMTYASAEPETPSEPEVPTWSGYELILQDGKYSVSETLTEGLNYSAVTPVVGSVYSQDALIVVGSYYGGVPIEGLVFYASLNGDTPDEAETGQRL